MWNRNLLQAVLGFCPLYFNFNFLHHRVVFLKIYLVFLTFQKVFVGYLIHIYHLYESTWFCWIQKILMVQNTVFQNIRGIFTCFFKKNVQKICKNCGNILQIFFAKNCVKNCKKRKKLEKMWWKLPISYFKR